MQMASQEQAHVPVRQFTEAEMKRYFSNIPRGAVVTAIIGAVLFIVGFNIQLFLLLGLVLLLIGSGIIAAKVVGSKPTDQEYDAWLVTQAQSLISRAINKLGLDPSQITEQPLQIHGFVLSGMRDAMRYRADEPCTKKGKDGIWRYSVNVYTFFFPEEHHLAAYVNDVNALNQSAHNEMTAEYFYRDVVGATTGDDQDTIMYKGKKYQYRIQRFALRITSGDSIGVSVNAMPMGNKQGSPVFTVLDSGIDQAIARLRMLLRSKKQGGV